MKNCLREERIEGEITLNEASMALRNMKHSKSHATDGLNAEFFKVFCSKIGMLVVRALNWGFRKGELSCTQRQGIITSIPKGDKRRDLINNWRPISLLNVVDKTVVLVNGQPSKWFPICRGLQTG